MSRFFVGQRVRIKAAFPVEAKCLVGAETRITGQDDLLGHESWVLAIPNPGSVRGWWGVQKDVADDYLEPILDQHQPCDADFKEALDRLAHEGVKAELTAYLTGIGENAR